MKSRARSSVLDLLVGDLLAWSPAVAPALKKVGMGSCLGCAMSRFETVAEAARELRLDPDRVGRELEKAMRGVPR